MSNVQRCLSTEMHFGQLLSHLTRTMILRKRGDVFLQPFPTQFANFSVQKVRVPSAAEVTRVNNK